MTLQIQQGTTWNVGKDAFLACTSEVVKNTKSQGLGKAFFSGEDLFIYNFTGEGVAWLKSFGAVETKHVSLHPLVPPIRLGSLGRGRVSPNA